MEKTKKKNIEDIIALTPMQKGMLFHYLSNPGSDQYFEQLSLEITGGIDVELFQTAWNLVIETNEMLRTVFRWEKIENPIQINLKEFFEAYRTLSNGKELVKPIKTKFKEFVKWTQDRDIDTQKRFWQGYLKGREYFSI